MLESHEFGSILNRDLNEVVNSISRTSTSSFGKKRSGASSSWGSVYSTRPSSRATTAPSVKDISFTSPKIKLTSSVIRDQVMDEIVSKPLTHVLTSTGKLKRCKSALGNITWKNTNENWSELKRSKTASKLQRKRDNKELKAAKTNNVWVVSNSTPSLANHLLFQNQNGKMKSEAWTETADSVPREEQLLPLKHEVELENVYKNGQNTSWCIVDENQLNDDYFEDVSRNLMGNNISYDVRPQTRNTMVGYFQSNLNIRIGINGETVSSNKHSRNKRPNSVESTNDEDSIPGTPNGQNSTDETHVFESMAKKDEEEEKPNSKFFTAVDILANDTKPNLVNPYAKGYESKPLPPATQFNLDKEDDNDDNEDNEVDELFEGCSPHLWVTNRKKLSTTTSKNESDKSVPPKMLSISDELCEKSNKIIVGNPALPPNKNKIPNISQPVVFHKFIQPHVFGGNFVHLTSNGYKDHSTLVKPDPSYNVKQQNSTVTNFSKSWSHSETIKEREEYNQNAQHKNIKDVHVHPDHLTSLTKLLKVSVEASEVHKNYSASEVEKLKTKEANNDVAENKNIHENSIEITNEHTQMAKETTTFTSLPKDPSPQPPVASLSLPLNSLTMKNLNQHNLNLQESEQSSENITQKLSTPRNSLQSSTNSNMKNHKITKKADYLNKTTVRGLQRASQTSINTPRANIIAMESELHENIDLSYKTQRGFSANPLLNRKKTGRSKSLGRDDKFARNKPSEFLKISSSMQRSSRENITRSSGRFERSRLLTRGDDRRVNNRLKNNIMTKNSPDFNLHGASMRLNLDKYIHLMYRDLGIDSKKRPPSLKKSDSESRPLSTETLKYIEEIRAEDQKKKFDSLEGLKTGDLLADGFNQNEDMIAKGNKLSRSHSVLLPKRKQQSRVELNPATTIDANNLLAQQIVQNDRRKMLPLAKKQTSSRIITTSRKLPTTTLRRNIEDDYDQDDIVVRGVTKVTVNIFNKF